MAILGFPLIIPQILILIKIANIAFADIVQNGLPQLVGMLAGFDIMGILKSNTYSGLEAKVKFNEWKRV